MSDKKLHERFWSRVDKTETCWNWTGKCDGDYGRLNVNGHTVRSHRVAWEMLRGPIPAGLTLDHLCMNKRCVNPAHLEVVTVGENSRRFMLSRTHCKHGHAFTPENTTRCSRGRRRCRSCEQARDRSDRYRKEAA